MGALEFPQGVTDALDARRCSFLWAGDEWVADAQCLVSWDKGSLPKIDRASVFGTYSCRTLVC
jgi:hypothetical protein